MNTKIDTPVSVNLAYDHKNKKAYPKWIVWNNRLYSIRKIGLHHTYREGRTLYHVFSAVSKTLFFRLILNTDNLHWKLEEIADNEKD